MHRESTKDYVTPTDNPSFISLKGKKFISNGHEFFPVALNYIVSLNLDGSDAWVSPAHDYGEFASSDYSDRDSSLIFLKADMELIKQSGFNTVRLVGVGEMKVHDYQTGDLVFPALTSLGRDTLLHLMEDDNQAKYLNALKELFDIVNQAGLKLIFLNKMLPDVRSTELHFGKMAHFFRMDTCILAYDLFNEPLYFDIPSRPKQDVYEITKRWKKIMMHYAPNHLYTIGLEGIREVFAWDPNIINADFISYHPYEYEPDQVRNEIYWYSSYTDKPWIIGETAIPADNDSVSYEDQRKFANKTITQTINCGASGYSWWQYKDVKWSKFHPSFMGVFNREGETPSKTGGVAVKGTAKPVVEEFKNFKNVKNGECICLPNYYNYSMNNKYCLKGKLTNEKEEPIDGGVILAWNEDWTHSYHSITRKDGSFEVWSEYPFFHWRISATYHTVLAEDVIPDTMQISTRGSSSVDLGNLKIRREF